MHALAPLIYDLAIMLGLAGIVTVLFQRIHQPVVLGYLVAGVIIGPYTPPYALVNDIPNIKILSELGVIFLMFSLGLEFSFHKLMRVGVSATVTGVLEVIFMMLVGYGIGKILGWTNYDCLFLGAALAISSTTIIIKAITELGLKSNHFAHLVFGILIIEDLLAILLLVALSTIVATNNIFSFDMMIAAGRLVMVVGSWFLIGYFIVPTVFRGIAKYVNQETLTIISVALCLTLVSIAAKFEYSPALGAFIMGSILAETTVIRAIENSIRPIRDIFAAVFFISIGMLINPFIIIEYWPAVLIIALATIIGKIIFTSFSALLTGQTFGDSVRVGASMAQIGEFSFIIAALGLTLHVTSSKLYPIIVAVSALTTFTTPYLIRFSGGMSKILESNLSINVKRYLNHYYTLHRPKHPHYEKKSLFRLLALRVFTNGIIIAFFYAISDEILYQWLLPLTKESELTDSLCLLFTLVCASPFMWGLIFATEPFKKLYSAKQIQIAKVIIWLLMLLELIVLSIVHFYNLTTVLILSVFAVTFFAIANRQLGIAYFWFERKLKKNIKSKE